MQDQGHAFDIRNISLLAVCARHSTFSAVARELGSHQSTIARKLTHLESQLGLALLNRGPEGFTLTAEGLDLIPAARAHESAVRAFHRKVEALSTDRTRTFTIQAPEGLGSYWITPHYVEANLSEDVRLDLICSNDFPDLERGHIDIAIQYSPAQSIDCIQIVLGYLHIIPFASTHYIKDRGQPTSVAELSEHVLISQRGPQEISDLWFEAIPDPQRNDVVAAISLYTDSGSAHYAAVRNGFGIGAMPSYAAMADTDLIPIDLDLCLSIPIYAVFERKSRDIAEFRDVLDWLKQIFSEQNYPYFGREPVRYGLPDRVFEKGL